MKRITEYEEVTEVSDNDYLLLDSLSNGSRKIKATAFGNATVISLSQSEYDALSNDEKTNGTVYKIGDTKIMYLGDSYIKQS